MKIGKKFIIYLLVGFLSFSSVSITYYKSAHAFEWVGGAISFVEAMKWLLGALGVLGGVAITHDLWVEYADDFEDWAIEAGNTHEQVTEWQAKLCMGVLDKGSSVWTAFKSWASSLVTENSGGSVGGVGTNDFNSLYQALCTAYGVTPISVDFSYLSNYNCYGAIVWNRYTGSNYTRIDFLLDDYNYTYQIVGNNNLVQSDPVNTFHYSEIAFNGSNFSVSNSSNIIANPYDTSKLVYWGNINVGELRYFSDVSELDYGNSSAGSLDTINDARQEQFDLINRITGDEVEQEVAIPMPGVSSSDDTISQDIYDDIIDRVNDGDITTEQAVDEIQELLKVLVYDTVTDDVIPVKPDPDTGENEKKEDVIKDNKNNMGFTLAGLENVFPFCIPWDIYAFLNILNADPVAPVFNIPFPNVDDPEHPLSTQVDLSSWDDVMRIVRLAQDFLFIIGLAFLTRPMIGAGGGD